MADPRAPSGPTPPNPWEAPTAALGEGAPSGAHWGVYVVFGYVVALFAAIGFAISRPLETAPLYILGVVVMVFFFASAAVLIGAFWLIAVRCVRAVASVLLPAGRGGR